MPDDRAALSRSPSFDDVKSLATRLREAEETLDAIRGGEVDAVVVDGAAGQQVYTLQNADRPYRVLIEQMQEGAITLSQCGTILYCNQRFATLVGRSRTSLISGDVGELLDPAAAPAFLELLRGPIVAGVSGEFSLRVEGGGAVWVNISLADLEVEHGAPAMVCGVVTDLTHPRRRADELAAANAQLAAEIEERRRAEDSLQVALDAAGMGNWDLDLRTGMARRSLRHDEIFGYPRKLSAWGLTSALEHFVPSDRDLVVAAFDTARARGSLDFEARITRADDGATRWLHVKGRTFYDDGQPVRIAGVVTDVTERRVVEEQLRHSQKIEAIGRLTGGVAHDFNNLLMVISGGLEMIGRQQEPARRERVLQGMRQAVERGSTLSRQLLAFSRRQSLQPEPIDLAEQVGAMRDLLDRSLRGDVEVRTQFGPDLWPVEVDAGELELVVLNLAVNARDAMPAGGVITIKAANRPAVPGEDIEADCVELSVVDTGIGMQPEILARAFEPFFTTKEIGKGSGLGLAQTHGFARASGGSVRIVSEPGRGTTVSLYLPRTEKPPVRRAGTVALTSGAASQQIGPGGQVLLVEDDDEVAALTAEMIEQLGYETTRVASAEAALGALANGRAIDLVFSDVMMPGKMNGLDLAREIRARRPGLPVVLTTGYVEAARQGTAGERIAVLPKPYRLQELRAALARARRGTRA